MRLTFPNIFPGREAHYQYKHNVKMFSVCLICMYTLHLNNKYLAIQNHHGRSISYFFFISETKDFTSIN